ncbi:hypothetical protein, partial [Treponema endosymbiont of Eucomonympha sp.]|uniref:hypothetical protein n=1 Tax=Treponema endosymbiont of Eucomonympha sp. TaxID=1580831 RepID=UPI0016508F26
AMPKEHKPKVNREALERFRNGFNFKEHLKQKLAEGYKFDFDAQRIIDGAMTEDDCQLLIIIFPWCSLSFKEKGTTLKEV